MHSDDTNNAEWITASLVKDAERVAFLPSVFGDRLFLLGEATVYRWMGHLCPAYEGGFWLFYTLSNGGFYLAPQSASPQLLPILVEGNGYAGFMSADAAGIVATLYALSHLLFQCLADDDQERFERAFYRLREFALAHAESTQILAAID